MCRSLSNEVQFKEEQLGRVQELNAHNARMIAGLIEQKNQMRDTIETLERQIDHTQKAHMEQ